MNIQRLTVEEAQQYISCKDDLMGYPSEYYTLTPSEEEGWDEVTYYTSRKKTGINHSGEGKYWIYVLSNESMPDVIKIGHTKQSPKERANQISSATGVATPFKVEYAFKCHEGEFLEAEIHKHLESCRVRTNREFFNIGVKEAKEVIEEIGKRYV
jgi:hypothetical protein